MNNLGDLLTKLQEAESAEKEGKMKTVILHLSDEQYGILAEKARLSNKSIPDYIVQQVAHYYRPIIHGNETDNLIDKKSK